MTGHAPTDDLAEAIDRTSNAALARGARVGGALTGDRRAKLVLLGDVKLKGKAHAVPVEGIVVGSSTQTS